LRALRGAGARAADRPRLAATLPDATRARDDPGRRPAPPPMPYGRKIKGI